MAGGDGRRTAGNGKTGRREMFVTLPDGGVADETVRGSCVGVNERVLCHKTGKSQRETT